MRAQNNVYHVNCFTCVTCHQRLVPGDRYSIVNGSLICEQDYPKVLKGHTAIPMRPTHKVNNNNNNTNINNRNESEMLPYYWEREKAKWKIWKKRFTDGDDQWWWWWWFGGGRRRWCCWWWWWCYMIFMINNNIKKGRSCGCVLYLNVCHEICGGWLYFMKSEFVSELAWVSITKVSWNIIIEYLIRQHWGLYLRAEGTSKWWQQLFGRVLTVLTLLWLPLNKLWDSTIAPRIPYPNCIARSAVHHSQKGTMRQTD